MIKLALLVVFVAVFAFWRGRKYERKQFVKVGKKYPSVQDMVFRKRK